LTNRREHLLDVSQNAKRRIRFATDDNSQLVSICKVTFFIENHALNLEFEAEFYVCNIVEDMILANSVLKRTGNIYRGGHSPPRSAAHP
jgi:hypothetical protein